MKSYRTLALKELLSQKVTSILILIAVVLSTSVPVLQWCRIHLYRIRDLQTEKIFVVLSSGVSS